MPKLVSKSGVARRHILYYLFNLEPTKLTKAGLYKTRELERKDKLPWQVAA